MKLHAAEHQAHPSLTHSLTESDSDAKVNGFKENDGRVPDQAAELERLVDETGPEPADDTNEHTGLLSEDVKKRDYGSNKHQPGS